MGRVRECRCVVDDDTGRGVELVLDCIEQCCDRIGLRKICLEGEKAVGGLGATPTPRCNSDLVPIAGEFLSHGGTDPGPSSENKYHRVGCHCAFIVDGSQGFWVGKKLRYGIEEWSYLGAEMPSTYTSRVYIHSRRFGPTRILSEDS